VSEQKQDFLRRWSRLKHDAAAPKPAVVETPLVELPPLESLTFESDFKAFMHSKVEDALKRAALKKLFADPRFNVMDGLDTYIDDYTKADPFPEGLLARIEEVRDKLLAPPPPVEKEEKEEQEEKAPEAAQADVDPAQDRKAL
jgi:hypothetical protein